jgi:hypothetical protein
MRRRALTEVGRNVGLKFLYPNISSRSNARIQTDSLLTKRRFADSPEADPSRVIKHEKMIKRFEFPVEIVCRYGNRAKARLFESLGLLMLIVERK